MRNSCTIAGTTATLFIVTMNSNSKQQRQCSVEGCGSIHCAKGFCGLHYMRFKRYGNTSTVKKESHGKWGSKEYRIWRSMKDRCNREKCPAFKNYGGRGIFVCDEWNKSFPAFFRDMGSCPNGMTLERVNNDMGYNKENCKWATWNEQARNKRAWAKSSSPYVGVSWDRKCNKWRCQIQRNGVKHCLGWFNDEKKASEAYTEFSHSHT